jgi:acetyltransferase-like isoleucine patch superfamily enzyme
VTISCHFDRIATDHITGWAWDPEMPDAAIVVELFDGDALLGSVEATLYRADLERARYRGGHCAFDFHCAADHPIRNPAKIRGVFRDALHPGSRVELQGHRTHDDGWVDFGANPLSVLRPLGLGLESVHGRQWLGDDCLFETPIVVQARLAVGANLKIGAFTGIYGGSIDHCSIGRYCSIAADAAIGHREHAIDWLTSSLIAEQPRIHDWHAFVDPQGAAKFQGKTLYFTGTERKTTIGNDVWLGNGVFVRAGVTIGDGAIIGARSVVVRDVPSYAIAVGNPARVKRLRFPDRIVERLTKLQWWRYSLYDLLGTPFDRIEVAIEAIEARIAAGKLAEYRPEPYSLARLRAALAGKSATLSRAMQFR